MALLVNELGSRSTEVNVSLAADTFGNASLLSFLFNNSGVSMTYVASPSHAIADPARSQDLKQCLDTARKRLDETSHASDEQKQAELIASAIDAGWEEEEVCSVSGDATNDRSKDEVSWTPTLGIVPSSLS